MSHNLTERLIHVFSPKWNCSPPFRNMKECENAYGIRFGDYRVIYTVANAAFFVVIPRVRHRHGCFLPGLISQSVNDCRTAKS